MAKRLLILLAMLSSIYTTTLAQWSFDVPSVEAYIADHKKQRSMLLARSTLEQSNILLHEYSKVANVNYKDINVELDKYTRAFDIIDILYQTLRTSLNARDTYNTVHDRIGDYRKMLQDFNEKCLSRGNIVSTDTLIIAINMRMLEKVLEEGERIYNSFNDLVLYATGAAACSTSDLMFVITCINRSLDNIEKQLNNAYFDTWRYIQVRIGYWKAKVYKAKTIREIANDAYGRWRVSGILDY